MAEFEKIETEDQLEAWLKTQDIRMIRMIAARAALRSLPAAMGHVDQKLAKIDGTDFVLACLRATLISGAASTCPTPDMRKMQGAAADDALSVAAAALSAADSAADYAYSAALSAADSADSAADSAYSAADDALSAAYSAAHSAALSAAAAQSAAYSAAYSSAFADAEAGQIDGPEGAFTLPLWPDTAPVQALLAGWQTFCDLPDPDGLWPFWKRWYRGMLEGEPMPWDLQLQIALIDAEIWEAGPKAVAEKIALIERGFRTQVTPRLIVREDGIFDVERDVEIEQEPLAFACGQVDISLAAAIAANAGNGFSETSYEAKLILHTLKSYGNQPSIVATSFWTACMTLSRNIGDAYPDDPSLTALKYVLYTSVEEICLQDTRIRERVARLAALETRRYPSKADLDDLSKVPNLVEDVTTARAQSELQEAVDIVVGSDKPPRLWRARLVSWITTLGVGIDKAQKGEKRAKWLLDLANRIADWFDFLDPPDVS